MFEIQCGKKQQDDRVCMGHFWICRIPDDGDDDEGCKAADDDDDWDCGYEGGCGDDVGGWWWCW